MKIRFVSDNDLPLNKLLKFHVMSIIIRSVFEDGTFYAQLFCMNYKNATVQKKLMLQEELMLINQVCQKNVNFVIIGFSKILGLNLKSMFAMDVMIY